MYCILSLWRRNFIINPLDLKGNNYSATSNNSKLVYWPLMGGLLHLVQRGGAWAGCGPAQFPPRCTKCNSPSINGQCIPITVLLYDGPLLCGFNVAIKGLIKRPELKASSDVDDCQCEVVSTTVVRLTGVEQRRVTGTQRTKLQLDRQCPVSEDELGKTQRHVGVRRLEQRNKRPCAAYNRLCYMLYTRTNQYIRQPNVTCWHLDLSDFSIKNATSCESYNVIGIMKSTCQ